ncbi:Cellulase (glycosyl hydrolase family 5) protein [Rhynchospora pubera]|uniref:Cellulase (Glycosyl hydrolase family 5) protein n=1 Tax=Rhynchospora pubera TaxID=906938 RepID=A0AAV8CLL8_9POAL|nr:Cellulase (glycosyl hydrolase family 5) protein [Rhynchospora pubera]
MNPFSPLLPMMLILFISVTTAQLSTNSRWIVDGSGKRVKLACVNWPSHLEPMFAEGLSKQPVDVISKSIISMGFNCVRLTWATFMVTNSSFASLTVRQSFQSLNLLESIGGIRANNPSFLNLTVIDAFKAVVSNLGANNIMVILDNHISKPGWCCSSFDGSGFFGDKYFDPDVWIAGLNKMATLFNGVSNVVGMSLRNELRGAKQNVDDWYKNMQRGAEAVHAANPDVLVILSGLSFDNDLSFLSRKQVNLSYTGKHVFELHWYGFSDGQAWRTGNQNQVCGRVVSNVMRKAGFLLDQGWPLFLSEWGLDFRGTNENDNRYFGCVLGALAEMDLDWALWGLQGSYYLREGLYSPDETYGLLAWDWCKARNQSIVERIKALQQPLRGPGFSDKSTYKLLFHPLTGLCVLQKSLIEPLKLGPCTESPAWIYTQDNTIALKDNLFCLKADGTGQPAKLGIICNNSKSRWQFISDSKMHLATNISQNDNSLCLDVGDDGQRIVTNLCKCLSNDQDCDPKSQWFKLVDTTRNFEKFGRRFSLVPSKLGNWKVL